jgi:hypothetical protein
VRVPAVLAVNPGCAVLDHLGVDVAAIEEHPADQALIAVGRDFLDFDLAPVDLVTEHLASLSTVRLAALRGVDVGQADFDLLLRRGEDLDGVAVTYRYDLAAVGRRLEASGKSEEK